MITEGFVLNLNMIKIAMSYLVQNYRLCRRRWNYLNVFSAYSSIIDTKALDHKMAGLKRTLSLPTTDAISFGKAIAGIAISFDTRVARKTILLIHTKSCNHSLSNTMESLFYR